MPFLPILLSEGYVPTISQGDTVSIGQILANRKQIEEIALNLSSELHIPPHKISQYIKKNPGDSFESGEVIALKKNFFGGTAAKIVSTMAGTVTRIERSTGEIFLQPLSTGDNQEELIISPIEGTIALCNNEKILIETDKNFLLGLKGVGGQETQEVIALDENETVESYHLQSDTIGKIVVGTYFPKEVLLKGVSIGVSAIIGTKILDSDLQYLQERKQVLPIIEVQEEDMKKMKKWHGKEAYVHGEGKTIILLHS